MLPDISPTTVEAVLAELVMVRNSLIKKIGSGRNTNAGFARKFSVVSFQ